MSHPPEWYAARRAGITATDLPKILGLSKYGNALTVWHDKRGTLPPDDTESEAARWGNLLEDVVAREWATRHPDITDLHPCDPIADDWRIATPDRHVTGCHPDGCLLEVKTRNQFTAGRWRDDMPDDVLAQVAWQRLVTGADHVHVAALIGGQRLVEHRYDSDQRLEDYLRERAEEVWDAVRADYPPLVDSDAVTAALMDVLFPDRSGEVEVPLAAAAELEDKYLAAAAAYRAAAEAKDEARAAVLSVLAGGDTLTAAGRRLFTYRPTQRRTVDLRKLAKTDPDLAHRLTDGGWVTETTSRTLRYQTRGDTDE